MDSKAQLSSSDSLWLNQLFTAPRYANDTLYIGNWYLNDTINSMQSLTNRITTNFQFSLTDFNHLDSMSINSNLHFDSLRNDTYNAHPTVFNVSNPLTFFDFELNGKNGRSYSFFLPQKDTLTQSKTCYLIIPGNGYNNSSEIVQGYGYHTELCHVSDFLRNNGDVFCYNKPNEDARAIHWNYKKFENFKLNDILLNNLDRPYGVNYLIELIATIRILKTNYCNVYVLGLSEGGYAGLLASLHSQPTASIISAGYSIGFDTSTISNTILYNAFDSLVYLYSKDSIKQLIQFQNTQYLFTYGDNDQVNLMQAEHDSNWTQQFLNDSTKCAFYYDYNLHTFPTCNVLDSFFIKHNTNNKISFFPLSPITADSMHASIKSCSPQPITFELYRNDTLYYSSPLVYSDTTLTLTQYGVYTLKNILNINSDSLYNSDSIVFQFNIAPSLVQGNLLKQNFLYPNPTHAQIIIEKETSPTRIYLFSPLGKLLLDSEKKLLSHKLDLKNFPSGIYYLKIESETGEYFEKIFKL